MPVCALELVDRQCVEELVCDVDGGRVAGHCLQAPVPPHLHASSRLLHV